MDVMYQVGKDFDADGVEISAHALCAEDHLDIQGEQMSNEDFDKLQATLEREIGTWNCRHFATPIKLGISQPSHTPDELKQYKSNSRAQIDIDGVTRSRYEWSQEMRKIETAVRYQKDIANAAKATGDDVLRRNAQSTMNDLIGAYGKITEGAGLSDQSKRMGVSTFRPVKTFKQLSGATKYKKATFKSDDILKEHLEKHLSEYGNITKEEYIDMARKLLMSPASDDIMVLQRSDGSVAKYRKSTNEFATGTKNGELRTAFKPKTGISYWSDEIERNK